MMRRPHRVALAAGSIAVFGLGVSAFAAMLDMSPPLPWTDTGAKPVVRLDAQKHPTLIALVIPGKLVNALPQKRSEAVYPVENAGLVRSANLQWHPTGHEPERVYDVPHFDVHFYTISESVRQTIVPNAPAGKVTPAPEFMPPDGILAPDFVPGMGMHNIPKNRPEFTGGKFSISPIIGYWNGDLAFFEVMFTKDWLMKKQGTSGTFPQPTSVKLHGSYPTTYRVTYDQASDAYQVAITDFIER